MANNNNKSKEKKKKSYKVEATVATGRRVNGAENPSKEFQIILPTETV